MKIKRNVNDKLYNIFNDRLKFVKIDLITNYLCEHSYYLRCKQTEIINKMMNEIKLNKNKKIKLMNMYNKNIHIYKKNL